MTRRKTHAWGQWFGASDPRAWWSWCGRPHGERVKAAMGADATCQLCLRAYRDHHLWRAEQSAREARDATIKLARERRRRS